MVNQRPWKSQKNSSCDGENTKINHVRQILHVIFTYHHKCMEHVGKYTSPMEHMGTGSSHIVWNNYSTVHEGFCSLTVGSLGFAAEFVSFWWPLRSVLTWFFNPFLLHCLMAQVKQKNYFLSIRGEDKQTNAWTLKSSPSNYWMNYCISCGIANLMQQKKYSILLILGVLFPGWFIPQSHLCHNTTQALLNKLTDWGDDSVEFVFFHNIFQRLKVGILSWWALWSSHNFGVQLVSGSYPN